MKTPAALLALLSLLLAPGSRAEDHHVSQKGAQFDPVEVSVRVGDRVVFHNDDDVTHNVFSKTTGAEFNWDLIRLAMGSITCMLVPRALISDA